MAHELDTISAGQYQGRKAMFSVKETPWHSEGTILAGAPNLDEAMQLAGADFEVKAVPIYTNTGDLASDSGIVAAFSQSPIGRAIVRTDRPDQPLDRVLGVVSDRYVPVQNREAFEVLEPLLDSGVASLETGGTLRGGKDVWMLCRFDVKDPVVQEAFADEIIPFGLITNNHTGEGRVLLMQTPIRVVCANTLGQALVNWKDRADVIAVRHRGQARTKVVEAAQEIFGSIVDRYRLIAEQYEALKARILTVEEFTTHVLDVASPLPGDFATYKTDHLTMRGYDRALDAAENRRAAITEAWENGKGHVGDRSAWEAYNGAVEVIDHDAHLFRTKGSRVAAIAGGRLLDLKQDVLDHVAVLANVERRGR